MWRLYDEVAKKGIDLLLFFCASFFLPLIAFNEFICRARGEVTNRIVVPVANSITIIITRRFDTCNLQHNISWKKVLKQTPVPLTIIVNIILNWPSELNRRDFIGGIGNLEYHDLRLAYTQDWEYVCADIPHLRRQ